MRTKEAVAQRILELCRERNIAVNALANISGVSRLTDGILAESAKKRNSFCPKFIDKNCRNIYYIRVLICEGFNKIL